MKNNKVITLEYRSDTNIPDNIEQEILDSLNYVSRISAENHAKSNLLVQISRILSDPNGSDNSKLLSIDHLIQEFRCNEICNAQNDSFSLYHEGRE